MAVLALINMVLAHYDESTYEASLQLHKPTVVSTVYKNASACVMSSWLPFAL